MKRHLLVAFAGLFSLASALQAQLPDPSTPSEAETARAAAAAAKLKKSEIAPADAQELATITVQDVPVDESTLPIAPTSSVYGFKTTPQDTPRSIQEITPEQFVDQKIKNSNDFIYFTPALSINAAQTQPILPLIRGQTGQVYVNGFLPGISGFTNGPSYVDNPVQSVDIVAGPASVVYGPSSNTSGYINYNTKTPYFDKFRGTATVDLGSWVSGGKSYDNFKEQVDIGGPIIKDKLAYRFSAQSQQANSYYKYVKNDYHDVYGALSWLPNDQLEVDYNIEWKNTEKFYSSGWNRNTQAQVDDGTYLAGPATPIIRVSNPAGTGPGTFGGASYYSPVLNADGSPTGQFVTRTQVPGQQVYTAGGAFNAAAAAAAGRRGQVIGFVLDPRTTTAKHVYGYETNTGPEGSGSSWEVNQQARVKYKYDDTLSIINEAALQGGSFKRINAAQTTGETSAVYFENRLHALMTQVYNFFGLGIEHESDSGIAVRYENVNHNSVTTPTTNSYGNLFFSPLANPQFGTQVYPTPTTGFSNGGIFGPVQTAFLPNYLTSPYEDWVATSGTATQNWDVQTGLFSQNNLKFDEQWGLNLGARADWLYVDVENPLSASWPNIGGASTGSRAGEDSSSFILPSMNASLTYKPVPWTTTYLTFSYLQAYNGGGPGAFSLTNTSATNPGELASGNFHSDALLYEAGSKFEFIPNQLFGTIAGYYQERARYNSTTGTSDPIAVQGVDTSLRYQPKKNFSMGVNFNWINAHYTNIAYSTANNSFNGNGLYADNATLFGTRALTNNGNGATAGNYRVLGIPTLNASGYIQYQFDFGLGFTARAWGTNETPLEQNESLVIPAQYNLDLGTFYERENWRADIFVTNATNARIINSSAGLLQDAPLAIQGRIRYSF